MFVKKTTALAAAMLLALPAFAFAAVPPGTTTPVEGSRNPTFAPNGHYEAQAVPNHPAAGTGNVLGGASAASNAGEGGSNGNGTSSAGGASASSGTSK